MVAGRRNKESSCYSLVHQMNDGFSVEMDVKEDECS